jgi:Protein of unknown function (DUF3515)
VLGSAGCGSSTPAVGVSPVPTAAPAVQDVCRRLVQALPSKVDDLPRRRVAPADGTTAAWGNPPVVLRCGVGKPAGLTMTSMLAGVNGLYWFIEEHPDVRIWTTNGLRANVEMRIPIRHDPPQGPMVDVAAAISATDPKG